MNLPMIWELCISQLNGSSVSSFDLPNNILVNTVNPFFYELKSFLFLLYLLVKYRDFKGNSRSLMKASAG